MPRWDSTPPTSLCEQCGAVVVQRRQRSGSTPNVKRFCSHACYADSKRRLDVETITDDDLRRLWSRIDRSAGDDACWIWHGAAKESGHGKLRWCGREQPVGRVVLELTTGEGHAGRGACHTCDNPPCANPKHLFWGTQKDNMQDCAAKGRTTIGERNARAKLTEDDVRQIRARRLAGESRKSIAEDYGIHPSAVTMIALRQRWKHVA
jgi:hypothetical protein